ncbi:MAG: ABC transporter ATP-binding protein/permease [Phycisphaerales bacterium]|nr:ABC transporter ATP-binding protein/permease [Phycisphaerales bacterium]
MTTFNELMKLRRQQRQAVAAAKTGVPGTRDPNAPEDETGYKPLEWPVVKKLLQWMWPYRKQYAIALLLNITFVLLDMSSIPFMQHLIDHDIPGHRHFLQEPIARTVFCVSPEFAATIRELSGKAQSFFAIGLTISLWVCAVITNLFISRFNIEYNRRVGEQVLFSIRKAVFNHLQKLSMSFYDRTKFGRILSRGTTDIDTLANPIINGVNTVVVNIIIMCIAVIMLLAYDWRVALAILWLGPVLYGMNRFYRKRIGNQYRIVREHFTRVTTNLVENINGMRVVTAYNRQEDNLARFNDLQDWNTVNNVSAAMMNGLYMPLLSAVGYIGKVIIFIYGCYLALQLPAHDFYAFKIGSLIAMLWCWDWFMGPVLNFGTFQTEMMQSMVSAERVFALLDQKPDVTDAYNAFTLPPIRGHVAFQEVYFHYVKGKPVLHDINFQARPGQTIALVGHTGCGKSTIMNLICRFYLPQSGKILVDDYDITQVTSESLHKQMGIVSQNNYLFSGTVLDNIRYASPHATEAQIVAAAKQLGSHEILENLKDGYHTEVGERGAAMSLGQRQLICFTRAFLANPRILMLDEATSAVDTHTEMVIQEALNRLVADRTTFIVAHRLSTVTRADLVLVLDHGKIIERGTHRSLLDLGGKYAELYKQFTREIE